MFRAIKYIVLSSLVIFTMRCSVPFPEDGVFEMMLISKIVGGFGNRIFRTTGTPSFSGNLGGVDGADATCTSLAFARGFGRSKAILAAATRIACTTANCGTGPGEHLNWVLKPSFSYYRPDGALIGTTNSNAIFTFPLNARFDGSALGEDGSAAPAYWTGLNADWTNHPNNCINWTSVSVFDSGRTGDDTSLTSTAISTAAITPDCTVTNADMYILCVEQ